VIDAVDRVLEQRAALDRGFGATLALSTFGHVAVLGMALFIAWLGARAPRIREVPGFAIPLPRGGGGPSAPEPRAEPAPAPPPVTAPPAPAAKPEPPPKVLKPPKEEPRKGLPALDSKKTRPAPAERTPAAAPASTTKSGTADTGIPGLDIQAPAGLGVPGGNDANGDWYLAGVQRKIWLIWTRQIKSGFTQPITVSLTITETGALEDVRVVESGGVPMLDTAAQRAVYSAAPFTPLPRSYGTNRLTIRAVFHPGT
jgi:TonB family protein